MMMKGVEVSSQALLFAAYDQCYNAKCNFPWIMTGMTIRCNVTRGYD